MCLNELVLCSLEFNLSKCKYMILSRKNKASYVPSNPSFTGRMVFPLTEFILILGSSFDLWPHLEQPHRWFVIRPGRSLDYCTEDFTINAPASTLFQLYLTWCILILSMLRQCSPIIWLRIRNWLRMCRSSRWARVASKNWTMTYHDLLDQFNLLTLKILRRVSLPNNLI